MKIGLNVGSGQRPFRSGEDVRWINVDNVERPNQEVDLVCDAKHLPYDAGSIDYFVLHHVLEHFGCGEGMDLIREAYRVLKPNGSLLVFVPNIRELACHWMRGQMSTQLFMTNLYGAYMGSEEDRHKWGYDPGSLMEFLSHVPFKQITEYDGRPIPGSQAVMDWWILALEAIR